MTATIFNQFIIGLARSGILFLAASGLAFIFGVLRVINFAHGALYMLGAYFTFTFINWLGQQAAMSFWIVLIITPLVIATIGGLIEVVLFRRVYGRPIVDQFLLAYGVILLITDSVKIFWGPVYKSVSRPSLLSGSIEAFGTAMSTYYIFVLLSGLLVMVGFLLLLYKTKLGIIARAAVSDRLMVSCLGIPIPRLFTSAFVIGALVVGLAGFVAAPLGYIGLGMDFDILIQCFAVMIIGGMGSIPGAALGALIIGESSSFAVLIWPRLATPLIYIIMAVMLILRPWGLFGKPEEE